MQLTAYCAVSNAACSQSQSASHSSLLADETLLTNVMCGVLSGVISSSIANPTDVLKVAFWRLRWISWLLFKEMAICNCSKAAEQVWQFLGTAARCCVTLKNKALSFHFFMHKCSCTYIAALREFVLNLPFLRRVTNPGCSCGLLIACRVEWRAPQCDQDPTCGLFIEGNL